MRIWLTRFLWLLAIFLLVWVAVVIYWQSTSRLPSESDIVVYLGILPLAIAAVAWGGYKLATRPPAAPSASGSASGAAKADDSASKNAALERIWTINIAAASLHTAVGSNVAEVLGKLKDGSIEPELDPELKSPDGFAVFSARVADLDDSETREALAVWQTSSTSPDLIWSDAQYRALHLAAASTQQIAEQAVQHVEVQKYLQLKEEGRPIKDDALTPLRLIALWPTGWSPEHQLAGSGWLKALVVEQGWPAHKILMQEVRPEHANPIALLDHLIASTRRAQLPTIGILIACDSQIDQDQVDALAGANNLFGGKNAHGTRPGELAAGVLFADAQQSVLLGDLPCSSLHRASWASRDKSADEKGRITAELLGGLVDLALETAKLEAAKVHMLCTDNDHKPSRESELAEMLNAKLPELDLNKDALKITQACGSMRHSATLASLCIAHQLVVDEQEPVVCTSLQDPLLRAAVILSVPAEIQDLADSGNSKAT